MFLVIFVEKETHDVCYAANITTVQTILQYKPEIRL